VERRIAQAMQRAIDPAARSAPNGATRVETAYRPRARARA
jgi:hypothetical protein